MTITSQDIGSQLTLGDVLRIVIGGGVASSAALLLGLGPIGAVASGVVGAVGIEMLGLRRRSGNRADDYEQYGRELILHAMREASLRVQEQVQGNRQALREALKNELDTVEAILDQALHESRSPLEANNPFPAERARLQEYRRKLSAHIS